MIEGFSDLLATPAIPPPNCCPPAGAGTGGACWGLVKKLLTMLAAGFGSTVPGCGSGGAGVWEAPLLSADCCACCKPGNTVTPPGTPGLLGKAGCAGGGFAPLVEVGCEPI